LISLGREEGPISLSLAVLFRLAQTPFLLCCFDSRAVAALFISPSSGTLKGRSLPVFPSLPPPFFPAASFWLRFLFHLAARELIAFLTSFSRVFPENSRFSFETFKVIDPPSAAFPHSGCCTLKSFFFWICSPESLFPLYTPSPSGIHVFGELEGWVSAAARATASSFPPLSRTFFSAARFDLLRFFTPTRFSSFPAAVSEPFWASLIP